ncbi:hypothetical protein Bbelb_378670 [Branchiostoma belcheri]|nr:hypothetical protein Bbelb_378670 [Branchiostoma belcheri]
MARVPLITITSSRCLLCPEPCPSHSVPERAQNGTQPDCPGPCPEALSIIVIGGNLQNCTCVRSGTVLDSPPRVPECRFSPGTVWDTRRVSPGTVWDTRRVSQTMPSMVWDKASACPELCSVSRHGLGHAPSVISAIACPELCAT